MNSKVNGSVSFGTNWVPAHVALVPDTDLYSCIVAFSAEAAQMNIVSLEFILPEERIRMNHTGYKFQLCLMNNALLEFIQHSSINELCTNLPVVISCIEAIPFWMNGIQSQRISALQKRLDHSPEVSQMIRFYDASNKYASRYSVESRDRVSSRLDLLADSYASSRDSLCSSPIARSFASSFSSESGGELLPGEGPEVPPVVKFWIDFANQTNLSEGSYINIPHDMQVFDPISPHGGPLHRFRIEKIMNSATKPMLLQAFSRGDDDSINFKLRSKFLLKAGDDMRQDLAVLQVFDLINCIWAQEECTYNSRPIQAKTYKVVPITDHVGAIEFVGDCKCLKKVKEFAPLFDEEEVDNLIATAAGSYICSYVLGVRDRHWDNVLIQDDGTCFHIDFGFALGAKPTLDASKIAVTKDLQILMGDKWDDFITVSLQAFFFLQQRQQQVIDYAKLIFHTHKAQAVENYISRRLGGSGLESKDRALSKLKNYLNGAPDCLQTRFKNWVHTYATS